MLKLATLAPSFPSGHRAGLLGASLSAHLSPLNPFPGCSGDGSMTWPSGQISDYRSLASELTTGAPEGAIAVCSLAMAVCLLATAPRSLSIAVLRL